MKALLATVALLLVALPAAAQSSPERVVVAEIEAEAIRPVLTQQQVAHLVAPQMAARKHRDRPLPRFEQSWIQRGPTFSLIVDAQYADGNDFVMALPLETVQYGDRQLLVLVRRGS